MKGPVLALDNALKLKVKPVALSLFFKRRTDSLMQRYTILQNIADSRKYLQRFAMC